MTKPIITCSFSGGQTSGYMAYLLQKNWSQTHELHFIFANTGKENEETLVFANRCDKEFGLNLVWVEADVSENPRQGTRCKVVNFETASRNGEPFEAVIAKYGIPNMGFPSCSREMKAHAMGAYWKHVMGFTDNQVAIGIRTDEAERAVEMRARTRYRIIYPLIHDWPTTKQDVARFWASMPFSLGLKAHQGNCDLCWKKSVKKLIQIAQESPEKLDWWESMEEKYGQFRPESQPKRTLPAVFGRKHLSVKSLRLLAANQLTFNFDGAEDLDACGSESCEAF